MISNNPSNAGWQLGSEIARLTEATMKDDNVRDGRCATCAFRAGTNANGSLGTLANAIKCAVEDDVFLCHEYNDHVNGPCRGWVIMHKHMKNSDIKIPWDYIEGRDKMEEGDTILLPDETIIYLPDESARP